VQIDGSPFAWLGARGPTCVLLGAVDDATTEILALHFRPTEDVHGYATLFHALFTQHGLPLAVYGDRLNLLVRNDRHWSMDEQLAGTQAPTHLGRMLQDLGIGPEDTYVLHELFSNQRALSQGSELNVQLTLDKPAAIWRVERFGKREQSFDYFN